MDKKNDPERARQKAIDGILYGGQDAPRHPNAPHRRFRQAPVTRRPMRRQSAAAPISPPSPNTSPTPAFDAQAMHLDEVPVAPLQNKKRRHNVFVRAWRAVKSWSWKKKLIAALITLIILVGLVIGALALKGFFNAKKVFKGGGKAVSLQSNVAPNLLKGEGDGRINILLMGIGGIGHEAPDLTDTIMIASIDPVNHSVTLLSVPRDLWVTVPRRGSMKLNAVYETGKYAYLNKQDPSNGNSKAVMAGFAADDSTLEDVLGIPIHYHALVNFQAFRQAVDAVGGITVNVPTTLYDPTMAWQNGGNPVIAAAGTQHFNGTKALMYVRSRETSSDFARAQRQRAVIVALAQKALSLGTFADPLKISQLFNAFGQNVVTDLSLTDVGRAYGLTKDIPLNTVQSIGLTDPPHDYLITGRVGNQSVVLPKAGQGNYADIRSYVRNTLRDGYLAKENAVVQVLNGTSTPGLASSAAATLKSYGYNVGPVGDAPTKSYQKTVVVDLTHGKKPYTAQYLKKRYKVNKVATSMPDKSIQTQNAQFVVILGQDETSSSKN